MTVVAIISLVVATGGLGYARFSMSLDGAAIGMIVGGVGLVCLALSGLALAFG